MAHSTDNRDATHLDQLFEADLDGVDPDDPVPYWPTAGRRLALVREG